MGYCNISEKRLGERQLFFTKVQCKVCSLHCLNEASVFQITEHYNCTLRHLLEMPLSQILSAETYVYVARTSAV